MSVDYGKDLWCLDDFSPTMPEVTGRTVPIQRLVRRLYTPRGSCPDCPNDGIDVRDFLNTGSALTDTQIAGIIAGELRKDVACLDVTVVATFSGPTPKRTLTIDIVGELADGPFALVIGVDQLTVELLKAT